MSRDFVLVVVLLALVVLGRDGYETLKTKTFAYRDETFKFRDETETFVGHETLK